LHPSNPGNVLGYAPTGLNATKFALYDADDGLRRIQLNNDGTLNKTNTGTPWLLNFVATEGPIDTKWIVGQTTYLGLPTDGDDHMFGDLGNDWMVGGTGRDVMYSGWGDDLINADDNLDTNGGLNNGFDAVSNDTNPSHEDLAFGGAGRDVLILNTNGDRGIDWLGEFNTFLTPYAQFGAVSVSRMLQPQLPAYLYALSKSNGADPTLAVQYGNAARNGEPFGELGLVVQQDAAWQAQSGGPRDPQAGNTGGGKVDVKNNPGTAGIQQIYLTAAGPAPTAGTVDLLTESQLAPILAEAKLRWSRAIGAEDGRLGVLDDVHIGVGNLAEDGLGITLGGRIVIDADAAGHGWFVDPTPADDTEFWRRHGELLARMHSAAQGRMDLLSAVMHELGHVLGREHEHDGVMSDVLAPGVRDVELDVLPATNAGPAPGGYAALASLASATLPASVPALHPAKPVIDWSARVADLPVPTPAKVPAWASDFVSDLGRSDAERNPNEKLRVKTPVLPNATLKLGSLKKGLSR
jgi:hypothetical protein